MRERDGSGVRRTTHTGLIGVSLVRRRVCGLLLLPVAQSLVPAAWASAGRIASARMWPAQEYTRVIFESATPIEYQLVVLRDPHRVVLDLARVEPTVELRDLASHVQVTDPYVAGIRIGTPTSGFLRVVLDLKAEVNPQVFALQPIAEFGHRLVVDLYPLTPLDPLMALLESEQRKEAAQPQPPPAAVRPPPVRM